MFITAVDNPVFISFPSAQIYVSYIHLYLHHPQYIVTSQRDKLPVDSIALLVEHCTGIAEVMARVPFMPEFSSSYNLTIAFKVVCITVSVYMFFSAVEI